MKSMQTDGKEEEAKEESANKTTLAKGSDVSAEFAPSPLPSCPKCKELRKEIRDILAKFSAMNYLEQRYIAKHLDLYLNKKEASR